MLNYEILKDFIEHSDLHEKMNDCSHHNDDGLSKHHLEGSVWTHTMLTYKEANPDSLYELLMALCHDIGKIYTRKINDKGYTTFYNHDSASVQPTINFLGYLYKKNAINTTEITQFINHCLPVIGNHILYYNSTEKLNYIANGSSRTIDNLYKLSEMDGKGSICCDDSKKQSYGKYQASDALTFKQIPIDNNKQTITIWAGLPGSGKDYLAEKSGDTIVSFDDIRVDTYKKNISKDLWGDFSDELLYSNAFIYCIKKKINLTELLRQKIKALDDTNISICNTSLTRKSRRTLINVIGAHKYNWIMKQVFCPIDTILERNQKRSCKTIPESVIANMSKRIEIATLFENHISKIYYIFNQ